MRTLHQSKCYESKVKVQKAVRNTARKTKQKQASTLKSFVRRLGDFKYIII